MIALSLDELLAYTDEERGKWRKWLDEHPAALDVRLHPDGRFATVAALIDHIFLVEARHLARLQHINVPDSTGVAPDHIDELFAYAGHVRDALRAHTVTLSDIDAAIPYEVTVQSGGTYRITPRKLLLHVGLHEVRHWAQIALAVRQAGLTPPGNHDLFYSSALE